MNEKTYNMYLKMIKLACKNVKTEICKFNNIENENDVSIKIRNKDTLIDYVEQIVKNSANAAALYSNKIEPLLVISTKSTLTHTLTASIVFIESIIKSKDARVCQKQYIDYSMAEMYLTEAYDYDSKHPVFDGNTALDKAKEIITRIYSLNFLSNFVLDSGKPHLDETVRNELIAQAFDERYAFTSKESNENLIRKKYINDFGTRKDFFLMESSERAKALKMDAVKSGSKPTSMMDVLGIKRQVTEDDTFMITELYKGTFADLPLQNRRRKFVNLKVRNRDIMICPKRNLVVKRQYANIESLTKHQYIMDFYEDQMPESVFDTDDYYFKQEVHMYQYMWNVGGTVSCNNGYLYFPDGTSMPLAKNMKPHEFLHRVNTVYAALFGFSPEDMKGGNNWLYDTIRRAYTDEGTADYRLAMIDAKLKGRI